MRTFAAFFIWCALPADWATTSLACTSAPLERGTQVYGSDSADLCVAATVGDDDLQVTIIEARPDGQETYVQRGWLRLSNRALDEARSTQGKALPKVAAAGA